MTNSTTRGQSRAVLVANDGITYKTEINREAVQALVNEYRAAEKEDYPDYMDDDN